MESLTVNGRPARLRPFAIVIMAICTAPGCVTLDSLGLPWHPHADAPPTGTPYQTVATWCNEVHWRPDPVHNGVPSPGIDGRLYLFGPQVDFPLTAEGQVIVELYDATHAAQGVPPIFIERWHFDKETMKRLMHRDAIGWGYNVFLSWGTYRPDITQVELKVRFEPVKGTPLYAPSSTLALNHEGNPNPALARRGANGPAGTALARKNEPPSPYRPIIPASAEMPAQGTATPPGMLPGQTVIPLRPSTGTR
jgi:hypothetical protein